MSDSESSWAQLAQVASTGMQVTRALAGEGTGSAPTAASTLPAGSSPLPKVRSRFHTNAEPTASWHVLRFRVQEALSELYEATVDLALDQPVRDLETLLATACELRLEREGWARRFLGVIHGTEELGTVAGSSLVRIHFGPALWLLSQRTDSYIFRDMTVPQILKEVLEESLTPLRREVRLELYRQYPVREQCTQYAESDLDFALRLMAEEGIAFYFEHEGETETVVLVDLNLLHRPCKTWGQGPIWISNEAGDLAAEETVRKLEWHSSLIPTGVEVRDFDWTHPQLQVRKQVRDEHRNDREQYLHSQDVTFSGYKDLQYTRNDIEARARVLREGQQVKGRRGRGQGNVIGFMPGTTFLLQGHLRASLDQKYLLTRVEHLGEEPGAQPLPQVTQAQVGPYMNRFECIPSSVQYRPEPPRARACRLEPQTATVVGPAGEEIYTDEHGRVKVQFHWDRAGLLDEHSSCWVRVAQGWAGPGFGLNVIPRTGMEVLVDFIGGNPDRPIIIGCVFNGRNPPPSRLPEERTRSTLRTESTPGGGGYNELHFEDAKGQERVFLRAERDLVEVIRHDHATQVGASQTNTVKAHQTESVGGEQHLTVTGQQTQVLQAGRKTTIAGNDELTVSVEQRVTTDVKHQLTQGPTTLTFEGGHVELDAGRYIKLVHGAGEFQIEDTGKLVMKSALAIEIICGGSHVKLSPTGIELVGPVNVSVTGGASSVRLDPEGAALSGPKVSSSAEALHEVSGAMVKIN